MANNIRTDLAILNNIDQWQNIDDQIMGWKSRSHLAVGENGGIVFAGTLCSDNGSGFASIRSLTNLFDLSAHAGLSLKVKGDGRRYKLSLRCATDFDGIAYQATFPTGNNTQQQVNVSWDCFLPSYHGRLLTTAPPLDPSEIRSLGFIVAGGQVGSFTLEIARIAMFAGRPSAT